MNDTASAQQEMPARTTAWSPLRIPLFRALWLATIASSIGTWMHEIGAGWLMTSLSPTPVMVALVQTATTLPLLLLALPSGALADIIDRRRYLLFVQLWLAAVATVLGVLTVTGITTAWMLVMLTFAMGIGVAMMMPAWAAVTPEIVPRVELQNAIALNSMGMNVARAIGPAVAGIIVSLAGTGVVFLLNAVSFFAVMVVLYRWRRDVQASSLPGERFLSALRTGWRFARHHGPLHGAIFRGMGFFVFASASWALLPLIARVRVGGGPDTFGILVASIGAGAVAGALLLPRLRRSLSRDGLITAGTLLYASSMLALAWLTRLPALVPAMFASGIAWIAVLSSLQVSAQLALPDWVRSRGLAVFMATFMGSMALGSLGWGAVAQASSIPLALTLAAAGAMAAAALTRRWPVSGVEDIDLSPSMHWPEPNVHGGIRPDRGPVMVTVRYQVDPDKRGAFLRCIRETGRRRQRDGAFGWGIVEDTEHPHLFMEYFMGESWLEHLRQHERVTGADRELRDRLHAQLKPGTEPVIEHYIAPDRGEEST
ncbi:MFS transporter [Elongatibacter sediminis]|uniref:MFS transporter n=1 Tax=Elongatibacter sediminis TaxID=3119006 RepID=A0AAW9R7T1_9GAMM